MQTPHARASCDGLAAQPLCPHLLPSAAWKSLHIDCEPSSVSDYGLMENGLVTACLNADGWAEEWIEKDELTSDKWINKMELEVKAGESGTLNEYS